MNPVIELQRLYPYVAITGHSFTKYSGYRLRG